MKEKRQHIDFEVIWRKLSGISTEEDDAILAKWIGDDAMNREFFHKAEAYFSGDGKTDSPIDVEAALRKVKQARSRRIRMKPMLRYAAAVAAVLLMTSTIGYLLLSTSDKTVVDPIAQTLSPSLSALAPGKSKAVLTIDNGDYYVLSDEEELLLDMKGVQITGQGTGITYSVATKAEPEELTYNTLSIPYGGEFFMTLSDGTKVRLNSGTVLRYPVNFAKGERLVELDGEAFFEVAPNKEAPFRVRSHGQVVEALGTSFNVTAYTDDENVLTTLVSGKVKVYKTDHPNESEILLPGAQSCFSLETHSLKQYNVDVDAFVAWKSGWFVFRNTTLNDMMKTLTRWYDVEVVFANKNVGTKKFTGEIKRYDDLSKLLMIIEKTNEVKVEIEGKRIIMN